MKKILSLMILLNLLFVSHVFGLPLGEDWNLHDGLFGVLYPDGDGGNIGNEAAGRDTSPRSLPLNENYWLFDDLLRTGNFLNVSSHFIGVDNYDSINGQWEWTASFGSTHVWGVFKDDPFLFEMTDEVYFDYYGYNSDVGLDVYRGTMPNVPEPATMLLFGTGLVRLAGFRLRRKK